VCSVQRELKDLEPRLSFSPKLPASMLPSIVGQLGKKAGERAAWREARVEIINELARGVQTCLKL